MDTILIISLIAMSVVGGIIYMRNQIFAIKLCAVVEEYEKLFGEAKTITVMTQSPWMTSRFVMREMEQEIMEFKSLKEV